MDAPRLPECHCFVALRAHAGRGGGDPRGGRGFHPGYEGWIELVKSGNSAFATLRPIALAALAAFEGQTATPLPCTLPKNEGRQLAATARIAL
jgi:hypothetical protein